jgi:hypothetical protein
MTYSTQTLLPSTTYGTASGNYDGVSTAFIGNAIPAANFYGGQGSIQTATLQVTGFQGVITLQASLNDWTEQAMWFDINSYGNAITPTTDTTAITIAGNFVWVRAAVTEFTAGAVNQANLLY